jgi:hypothetical protein
MVTKIKMFERSSGQEKSLEKDVNEFIANKDVINVSMAIDPSGYKTAIVAYRE